jgi:hypothetical protein
MLENIHCNKNIKEQVKSQNIRENLKLMAILGTQVKL